jgi:diguanylate cyclase (GGDEF)-like protein
MIKRLQWLYPPTARKFMYNLLEIICGRVERLTTCLAENKVLDDATGLCNRSHFVEVTGQEIQRAKRYRTPLSLALVEVDFEPHEPLPDVWEREKRLRLYSDGIVRNIRGCDIIGRCDPQRFGLLFPQIDAESALMICSRLRMLLERESAGAHGAPVKIAFGVAGLRLESEEKAVDLLDRAAAALRKAKELC